MQFELDYTNAAAITSSQHRSMTLPRFIKHFVLAGAGFTPTGPLLARGLGAVAWYWAFLEPVVLGANRFGEPIPILRDPTLKAHFSNLAGRAFADFLAREIEQAWVTLSYEGVLIQLGAKISGARPDLLAVNPTWVVAIEAKGYVKRSISTAHMALHKTQAQQGQIARDSWAASVAYALYHAVRVNYLDPRDERQTPELGTTLNQLRTYFDLAISAAQTLGGTPTNYEGRNVWSVPLRDVVRGRVPLDVDSGGILNRIELLIERDFSARQSALDKLERQRKIIERQTQRHPVERPASIDSATTFIDSDGIGIAIAS